MEYEQFICPITHQIFKEPVILDDGITYEKEAITLWLNSHANSPTTNKPISKKMIDNIAMRNVTEDFLEANPECREEQYQVTLSQKEKPEQFEKNLIENGVEIILKYEDFDIELLENIMKLEELDKQYLDHILSNTSCQPEKIIKYSPNLREEMLGNMLENNKFFELAIIIIKNYDLPDRSVWINKLMAKMNSDTAASLICDVIISKCPEYNIILFFKEAICQMGDNPTDLFALVGNPLTLSIHNAKYLVADYLYTFGFRFTDNNFPNFLAKKTMMKYTKSLVIKSELITGIVKTGDVFEIHENLNLIDCNKVYDGNIPLAYILNNPKYSHVTMMPDPIALYNIKNIIDATNNLNQKTSDGIPLIALPMHCKIFNYMLTKNVDPYCVKWPIDILIKHKGLIFVRSALINGSYRVDSQYWDKIVNRTAFNKLFLPVLQNRAKIKQVFKADAPIIDHKKLFLDLLVKYQDPRTIKNYLAEGLYIINPGKWSEMVQHINFKRVFLPLFKNKMAIKFLFSDSLKDYNSINESCDIKPFSPEKTIETIKNHCVQISLNKPLVNT